MNKLAQLQKFHNFLVNPNIESLKLSMADTHHKDLFSLVINGTEFGKLTRVFIADDKIDPYEVQLHTHRYPIRLTTIKGNIRHYVANRALTTLSVDNSTVSLSEFDYKSPLNGGKGLTYRTETAVKLSEYGLPIGSTLNMTSQEFHTVSCDIGSIWIVEELGFETDSSRVLGVPFITEDLYNPPAQFQINDKAQLVKKELKKLILDYQLVID